MLESKDPRVRDRQVAAGDAWRRWFGQGPLERVVALAAGATRRRVRRRLARGPAPRAGG